jgi:hypothetical protein
MAARTAGELLFDSEASLRLVDRAIVELKPESVDADSATRAAEVRGTMRDELFGLMNHLQFQDITTQQLAYASSLIMEMEDRLAQLIKLFDPSTIAQDEDSCIVFGMPAEAIKLDGADEITPLGASPRR